VNEVFRTILTRAELPDAETFAAHEVAPWPNGALVWLMKAGILREAGLAEEILCDQCEECCWIKPRIQVNQQTGQTVGKYVCQRNEDVGPFNVDLDRKKQWRLSLTGLAAAVARAVGAVGQQIELVQERLVFLGTVSLDSRNRELFLARGVAWPDSKDVFGTASRLRNAIHPIILTLSVMPPEDLLPGMSLAARPLVEIAGFDNGELAVTIAGAIPATEPQAKAQSESSVGYDPDAYMPVKELREKMDPPCDFPKWTKIKKANSWIRFDPNASKQHPRIHRADAARLEKGKLNPDTFELLDVQGDDFPSVSADQLTDEYLADTAARKADIQAEKRRRRSV
jgi:hypothetical protein